MIVEIRAQPDVEAAIEAIGKTFGQLEWDDDSWSGAFRNCLFGCRGSEDSGHDAACYFVNVTNHLATLRAALSEPCDHVQTGVISATFVGLLVAMTLIGSIGLGILFAIVYGRF